MRLIPCDPNTKTLSHNFATQGESAKLLSPAVTVLKRENGHITVVCCGNPKAEFKYTEGFAFLNESRKKQFTELLREAKSLPIYCEGDNELCLRAGYLKDGTLLAAVFDLGFDAMDTLDLYLEKAPLSIKLLQADGSTAPVSFRHTQNNVYSLSLRVEPMQPCILLIN